MDFDDMPDSYFAFLSNQRKLAEPDKINGAMRGLGRGALPEPRSKVRSRTSQPNLSHGSKPSVPSLPSIQRTPSAPIHPVNGRGYNGPPSRPQLSGKPPTAPGNRPPMAAPIQPMPSMAPGRPMTPIGHPGPQAPGQMHASSMSPGGPIGPHAMNGMASSAAPMSQMAHPSQSHSGPHGQLSRSGHSSSPNMPHNGYGFAAHGHAIGPALSAPRRSNAIVFVLIAILVAAIGVLAYLVVTR
jgi:hypothetical protein